MNNNHKFSAPGIALHDGNSSVTVVVHPTSSETDESGEKKRKATGSPETWSTNSDSPTPTNSVTGRIWNKDILWQGLLGDEHRQLLGTEEESSDRHSSDDDIETDFQSIYQMSSEQFEYYKKQFSVIQPNEDGLVSGHIARVFFEKSRIPVEELRLVWQLCDVTKDGALSLSEFAAAMHLVVLKRNNIPLPNVLPPCLNPSVLIKMVKREEVGANVKEDLLDLDVKETKTNVHGRTFQDDVLKTVTAPNSSVRSKANDLISPVNDDTSKAQSSRNSPILETVTPPTTKSLAGQSRQWTKFLESPTSYVSTPGLKPVNFDMQRTAQAVVSDPQILHPVPLRVTPVDALENDLNLSHRRLEPFYHEVSGGTAIHDISNISKRNKPPYDDPMHCSISSPKDFLLSTDLSGVQLPHTRKKSIKNCGAISSSSHIGSNNVNDISSNLLIKDPPPPPPPRPYRHMRSSSLDLSKLKLNAMDFLYQNTSGLLQTEELDNTMDLKCQSEMLTPFKSTQRASAFEVYRKPMVQLTSQSTDSLQPDQKDQSGRKNAASQEASVFGSSELNRRVSPLNEYVQQLHVDNGVNMISFLRDFKQRNLLLIHLCQNLSIELLAIQQRKEEIRNKLNSFVKINRMNVGSKIPLANAADE